MTRLKLSGIGIRTDNTNKLIASDNRSIAITLRVSVYAEDVLALPDAERFLCVRGSLCFHRTPLDTQLVKAQRKIQPLIEEFFGPQTGQRQTNPSNFERQLGFAN